MYIYIYIYIYICVCVCIYIYIIIHTHIYIVIYTYVGDTPPIDHSHERVLEWTAQLLSIYKRVRDRKLSLTESL